MKLYKKDTKGKIRYLEVNTEKDELIQISGILDTDKPIEHRKVCTPKNVGKSNETSGSEQAIKELDSLVEEKLKEGYFYTIKEAETEDTLFPMLAKDYKKEFKKIDWSNCFVQPKLDGMRCLIIVESNSVKLKSRDGRWITTMKHIEEDFKDVVNGVYDGELYYHGKSFQENMELIKKWRNDSKFVKFHCYDVVSELSFNDRLSLRNNLNNCKTVEFVETNLINSEDNLKEYHSKFLQEGYEGTIVRYGDNPYKINGRSSNLLKYKDFIDISVEILDIIPAEQRPEWGIPILKLDDNKTFKAGMKYSHEKRVEFLANRKNYIGKTAEIRFFEYSDDGIPRFPVMVGIRNDK